MTALQRGTGENRTAAPNRRRAMLTAALLGLVALGFYFGFIVLVHYRHP